MRKLLPLATLALCTILTPAFADAPGSDMSLPADSRMKLMQYDESDVYTITTRYGYQTNIVFGDGEEIQTISVGDRSLWQIIPSGHRLFIRPMEEGVTTNMTVLTNRHSYQFDLKSLAGDKGGNIYVAKFTYPDDKPRPTFIAPPPPPPPGMMAPPPPPPTTTVYHEPPPPPPESPPAWAVAPYRPPVEAAPVPVGTPNYNYTYSGPDDQAPTQVYDDGKSTYIMMREGQPLPAVYVLDKGQPLTPSYYVKDNTIVVDRIAGEITLEGKDTVHIFNEMLNPR